MIVARSLAEIEKAASSVVTVGTFDGVHRGHQAIIREVVTRARAISGRSVVLTFDPHPQQVVAKKAVQLLMSLEERLEALAAFDLNAVAVIPFTMEFSRLSPREFYVRYIIEGIGASEVVEGHDHTFGRDREAGVTALVELGKEFGVVTTAVPPVTVGGARAGSSAIREALTTGQVERANELLGRPYAITGTVVHGDARGAQLGFPTANISPSFASKLIPANGVYAITAEWRERTAAGMLNIGIRPTVASDGVRTIEAHLFDVNESLYDASLTVRIHNRIRDEKKFASKEELITQLASDRERSKKLLATVTQTMHHL